MNFVGCVGKLMSNSGLERLMKVAFGGVEKMSSEKKLPMNVRALRIVAIEILRNVVSTDASHDQIEISLDNLSSHSKLAKHWISNLIQPVFIMMLYIRAEREGDFGLHLYACNEMLPYFFSAGHWNYARDGIAYLSTMENLPRDLLESFLKGEHVVHLKAGWWNGIWTDMAIESSYMKVHLV